MNVPWGCRIQRSRGRNGVRENTPASWSAVLCCFVVLACVFLWSACSYPGTRPAGKPAGKIVSLPAAPTNSVPAPNPEPATPPTPAVEANLESERNSLLEADLSFSRTSEAKGAAQAFYEFLVPDGVTLCAGEPPIRGREAIKVHLAAGPQGFFTWQPNAADVSRGGDVGYTWGTANFQTKGPDEKPRIIYSKYVTIWKKQNSGRWRVVLFSTSLSPPPLERRQ
jgi:ketosteroid isomerase-like protein